MPFLILTYVVQIACAVHALRRGYPFTIIFLIVIFPLFGCLIYLFGVLIPEWTNSRAAWQARNTMRNTLDPRRNLRQAANALEVSDTVENRLRMADELVAGGDPRSAVSLYQGCLDGLFEDNPEILLKLATAQFDSRQFADAKLTLENLIEKNPEYRSDEGHLLYARALEAIGEDAVALREYAAVSDYYSGPEARCHYGLMLERLGQVDDSRAQFQMVLDGAKFVTDRLRERHKYWLRLAESKLR